MTRGEPLTRSVLRLSGSLDEARERGFVGRDAELASLDEALDGSSDLRVLFLHGPGGIGKTTLLDADAGRHGGRIAVRSTWTLGTSRAPRLT